MRSLWLIPILASCLHAQDVGFQGGVWLKNSIAYYNKLQALGRAQLLTTDELIDASTMQGFILGAWASYQIVRQQCEVEMMIFNQASVNAKTSGDVKESERYASMAKAFEGKAHMYNSPSSMGPVQLIAVVQKYIDGHPERWADAPAVIVLSALKESFPPIK